MTKLQVNELIDETETLLAHLICADSDDACHVSSAPELRNGHYLEAVDAGNKLPFDVMRPALAHTFDAADRDRLYTGDARLLMDSVPDILGNEAEVAFFREDCVRWFGYRRLRKLPRGIFVAGKPGCLYEVHMRDAFADGSSTYYKRCAALTAAGTPLPCITVGSKGSDSLRDGIGLIHGASLIEDTYRPNTFTARVSDKAGVVFSVPNGAHLDLFRLRDAPLSPAGRRKAILHWVGGHLRRTNVKEVEVREHTRGVHDFLIAGLSVRIESNHRSA